MSLNTYSSRETGPLKGQNLSICQCKSNYQNVNN